MPEPSTRGSATSNRNLILIRAAERSGRCVASKPARISRIPAAISNGRSNFHDDHDDDQRNIDYNYNGESPRVLDSLHLGEMPRETLPDSPLREQRVAGEKKPTEQVWGSLWMGF